jgi:hypothetical protein
MLQQISKTEICIFFDKLGHRCTQFKNAGGRSLSFFSKFLGGEYIGVVKFFFGVGAGGGEGTPFLGFIAFLLTSLMKILEGGPIFIPRPPMCASMN